MAKKILITAGPTREPIDPVRYISNYSTGTFGYAIAKAFRDKNFSVCLISGPVELISPEGIEVIKIETADEMKEAVLARLSDIDCVVMTAAVADFKPIQKSNQKIKKKEKLTIDFEKTPDILAELVGKTKCIKVGFALETQDPGKHGKIKLKNKDLDLIIINLKNKDNDPFGQGKKNYMVMNRKGEVTSFSNIDKSEMAGKIVEKVREILK